VSAHLRVGLVINPTAGKNTGARIGREAASLLTVVGHEVVDLSAMDGAHAVERARAAIEARSVDVLVVAGGDGMVHLGVNLVAGTDGPLGIIAAGTGNDNARELGLPVRDAAKAVERIVHGATRRIDAVRVLDPHGNPRWFVGVLAAGFDAVVNERANGWRWPKGQMRYNLAIARELGVFRPIPYVVEIDGTRHETKAMLVAVANGPAYGGGMKVVPSASYDDGLVDVLILHEVSIPTLLKVFPRVFKGAHVSHPAVEILTGRRVRLEARGIVSYADGERFEPLPLECEVVPGAVTVLT
jgi:diacylglycerol kinase (ATP)